MPVMNPVLGREVRERLRSGRSFVVITIFLLILVGLTWLVYTASTPRQFGSVDLLQVTLVGRRLFEWVLTGMLALVLFFVPGVTSGAIAGERERQTLVPLQVTRLSPAAILWGKITASTAFFGLLVVASAPIFAVGYLFGGVTLFEIVRGLFGLLVVTLLVATVTVSASAFVRRTQGATVLAYALTIVLTVGAFVLMGVLALVDARDGNGGRPVVALAHVNPVSALAEITDPWDSTDQVEGPLAAMRRLVRDDGQGGATGESIAPRWILSVGSLALIAGACFLAAQRRIRTPAQVER